MMPNVKHRSDKSKEGRYGFEITDDPIFTDVLIQACSSGAVNIYLPEDAPREEIVDKTLEILSKANQVPVKVLRREEAAPLRELPREHVLNIASGLKALISKSRYFWEGDVASKPKYAKFALQHLEEGWPEIYEIYLDKEENVRSRIDEIIGELSNKVEKKLNDQGISVAVQENIRHIVSLLAESPVPLEIKSKIDRTTRAERTEVGWDVRGGAYLLCFTKKGDEVESLKERLSESIFNALVENKMLLQELKSLGERFADLDHRFEDEVELLILKLVDMRQLKGSKCEICKDTLSK